MPPVEVSEGAVRAMLGRWFPGETVGFTRLGVGVSTPVYRVTMGALTAYLRLAEQPGENREAEVRTHSLAAAAGVRVPEILRWEAEPEELDQSAALTAVMGGVPLSEYEGDSASAMQEAACDLMRLGRIAVAGYGWVDALSREDRQLVAEHGARAERVSEYRVAAVRVRKAGVLAAHLGERLDEVIDDWCALPGKRHSWLAHGDVDFSHIYVHPATGEYAGLIDFGEIRGADAFYDVAHAVAHAFDERTRALALALILAGREVETLDDGVIQRQAVAIATRALAIQLGRDPNQYRASLIERLGNLLREGIGLE